MWRRGLSLMVLLLTLVACGGDETPERNGKDAPVIPAHATCCVSGTHFVPGKGVVVEYAGRREEVCSRGCAVRFEVDPEEFLDEGK